jgi:cell division protein FtsA
MEGAAELAEEVFHMPVRLGVPQHVRGLGEVVRNPIHSTGVGLLLYGKSRALRVADNVPVGAGFRDVWGRMKSWFQGNF